jgi:hypothetical protein
MNSLPLSRQKAGGDKPNLKMDILKTITDLTSKLEVESPEQEQAISAAVNLIYFQNARIQILEQRLTWAKEDLDRRTEMLGRWLDQDVEVAK